MVGLSLLASTLLMGIVLVAAVYVVASLSKQRAHPVTDTGQWADTASRVAGDPLTWTVVFLGLTAVGVGGVLVYVTGATVAPSVPNLGLWLLGAVAGTVLLYLLWGVYHSVRVRGLHRPAALAAVAWMAGLLVLALVTLRLLDLV